MLSSRAKQNSSGSAQGRAGEYGRASSNRPPFSRRRAREKVSSQRAARKAHRRAAPPDRLIVHAPASPQKKLPVHSMHRQPCLFRFLLDLIGAAHEQLGRRRSRLDAAVGDRHHVKMVLRQAGAVVQRRAAGRVNETRAGGRHDRRRADAQHDLAADRTVEDLSVRHRDDRKAVHRADASRPRSTSASRTSPQAV